MSTDLNSSKRLDDILIKPDTMFASQYLGQTGSIVESISTKREIEPWVRGTGTYRP